MSKKKFDFVLNDDKGYCQDIFRFYPKGTHVHGFHDESPKNWKKVYKVYYSWKIMRKYYDFDDVTLRSEDARDLFAMDCDECSEIPNLANAIRYVIEKKEEVKLTAFGQPACDWIIEYVEIRNEYVKKLNYDFVKFTLWNNFTSQGFRFTLKPEDTIRFAKYLDLINDYALRHSEGI